MFCKAIEKPLFETYQNCGILNQAYTSAAKKHAMLTGRQWVSMFQAHLSAAAGARSMQVEEEVNDWSGITGCPFQGSSKK